MSNSHIFLKSGFLRAPLENGVGRSVLQLQRIVFKFCKDSGGSKGVREFIENDLINFAREKPSVVVYVKPRRHRSSVAVAEYLDGSRQHMSLHNMTREEVLRWAGILSTAQDASGLRLRKPWRTVNPSIQGPWAPASIAQPPQLRKPAAESSAYTKLLQMAKNQGITQ